MNQWWVSCVDTVKDEFVGGVCVEADDELSAMETALDLGIFKQVEHGELAIFLSDGYEERNFGLNRLVTYNKLRSHGYLTVEELEAQGAVFDHFHL